MLGLVWNIRLISISLSVLVSAFISSNVLADDGMTNDPDVFPQAEEAVQPYVDGKAASKAVETRHGVTTAIPVSNVDAALPPGPASCVLVDAEWQEDKWIPAHKICKYENSSEGIAWIEGYWQCTKATTNGACTVWEWLAGHWQK